LIELQKRTQDEVFIPVILKNQCPIPAGLLQKQNQLPGAYHNTGILLICLQTKCSAHHLLMPGIV